MRAVLCTLTWLAVCGRAGRACAAAPPRWAAPFQHAPLPLRDGCSRDAAAAAAIAVSVDPESYMAGVDELVLPPGGPGFPNVTAAFNETTGVLWVAAAGRGAFSYADAAAVVRAVRYTWARAVLGRIVKVAYGVGGVYNFASQTVVRAFPTEACRTKKFNTTGCTWNGFVRTCADPARSILGLPGYLATPDTRRARAFYRRTFPGASFYLGATDAVADGTFHWVTGPKGCPPYPALYQPDKPHLTSACDLDFPVRPGEGCNASGCAGGEPLRGFAAGDAGGSFIVQGADGRWTATPLKAVAQVTDIMCEYSTDVGSPPCMTPFGVTTVNPHAKDTRGDDDDDEGVSLSQTNLTTQTTPSGTAVTTSTSPVSAAGATGTAGSVSRAGLESGGALAEVPDAGPPAMQDFIGGSEGGWAILTGLVLESPLGLSALVVNQRCQGWNTLPKPLHPTGLVLQGSAFFGAVVANVGAVAAAAGVGAALGAALPARWVRSSLHAVVYPSLAHRVVAWLFLSTAVCASKLCFEARNAGHTAAGAAALGLLVAYLVAVYRIANSLASPTGAPREAVYVHDPECAQRPYYRFLVGPGDWVPTTPRCEGATAVQRAAVLLRPYAPRYASFYVVECAAMLVLGVTNATNRYTWRECGGVRMGQAVLFLCLAVAHGSTAVYHRPRDRVLAAVHAGLTAAAGGVMAAMYFQERDSGALWDAAVWTGRCATGALVLRLLLDIMAEGWMHCDGRRARLFALRHGDASDEVVCRMLVHPLPFPDAPQPLSPESLLSHSGRLPRPARGGAVPSEGECGTPGSDAGSTDEGEGTAHPRQAVPPAAGTTWSPLNATTSGRGVPTPWLAPPARRSTLLRPPGRGSAHAASDSSFVTFTFDDPSLSSSAALRHACGLPSLRLQPAGAAHSPGKDKEGRDGKEIVLRRV
eukprot:TRINITY_DN7071_c0_g2_i1.p1 TRINITY_DN7071_c0_g2~~TRINITY_DN7071_c0_g2_i1.p1  ORF type:complete len:925 (+),score=235.25 TRINITY_DN7071_c0_g2_i1:46-2820(+)